MRKIKASIEEKCRLLQENAAFTGLAREQLLELATPACRQEFKQGELLFQNDEKAAGFFILCTGEVEILRSAPNGREQILHILEAGEMCGEVPVFHGGRYPASARARVDLEALFLPGEAFYAVAMEQPQILLEMLAVICMRMRHFTSLISELSLKDVTARLAGYLMRMPKQKGALTLDCAKSELAARLGTIPETLSRSLNRLKTAGALAGKGEILSVIDEKRLEEIAAGDGI